MPRGRKAVASLAGQLLVAMPQMGDPRFERSVIYLCAHSAEGALGLVINRPFRKLTFPDLLEQLDIERGPDAQQFHVLAGGPVEEGRGFVLHTDDYLRDDTLKVMMVADGSGDFAKATGLELDLVANGMGVRSKRFSMLVENGVVKTLNLEKPGAFEVSDAATMLGQA